MEKRDKQGELTLRQRNEKNEMKSLLVDHDRQEKYESERKAPAKVVMLNAFGREMTADAQSKALLAAEEEKKAAEAEAARTLAQQERPVAPDTFSVAADAAVVVEGEVISSSAFIDPDLQKKPAAAASPAQPEIETAKAMHWDPKLMVSLVPGSVIRKKTGAAAKFGPGGAANPGRSGAASLAQVIAPSVAMKPSKAAVQPPAPADTSHATSAIAHSFKTVNLVPENDDSSDGEGGDAPATYTPAAAVGGAGTSLFFSSAPKKRKVEAAAPLPPPPPPPHAAPEDDEMARFLAGL
ncbi:hypothetical protein DIPPA_30269 [Diplonema papillatum]|nr:hypothetical protein DIPPA_30269 [Diplonema papillatum]